MFGRVCKVIGGAVAGVVGLASSGWCALDFSGITMNTSDVETVMGLVIPGLAALWGFRKVVKTINRS